MSTRVLSSYAMSTYVRVRVYCPPMQYLPMYEYVYTVLLCNVYLWTSTCILSSYALSTYVRVRVYCPPMHCLPMYEYVYTQLFAEYDAVIPKVWRSCSQSIVLKHSHSMHIACTLNIVIIYSLYIRCVLTLYKQREETALVLVIVPTQVDHLTCHWDRIKIIIKVSALVMSGPCSKMHIEIVWYIITYIMLHRVRETNGPNRYSSNILDWTANLVHVYTPISMFIHVFSCGPSFLRLSLECIDLVIYHPFLPRMLRVLQRSRYAIFGCNPRAATVFLEWTAQHRPSYRHTSHAVSFVSRRGSISSLVKIPYAYVFKCINVLYPRFGLVMLSRANNWPSTWYSDLKNFLHPQVFRIYSYVDSMQWSRNKKVIQQFIQFGARASFAFCAILRSIFFLLCNQPMRPCGYRSHNQPLRLCGYRSHNQPLRLCGYRSLNQPLRLSGYRSHINPTF